MYEKSHKKWIELNPNYTILWYDNEACSEFMKKFDDSIYQAYNKINNGAFKADLWRLCVLYTTGGVYIDSFSTPNFSLDELFDGIVTDNEHQFISVLDHGSISAIHNGFIACTPHHPFVWQAIKLITHNILTEKQYQSSILEITGPIALAQAVNQTLGRPDGAHFNLGWNFPHDSLSFYLLKHHFSLYQGISRPDTEKVYLYKKYSPLHHFARMLFPSKSYSWVALTNNFYNNKR